MTILLLIGDWLLILSSILLVLTYFRAYIHTSSHPTTTISLITIAFLTLALIIFGIINTFTPTIFHFSNKALPSFYIFIMASFVFTTFSWIRPKMQFVRDRFLLFIANALGVIGFLLMMVLLFIIMFSTFAQSV